MEDIAFVMNQSAIVNQPIEDHELEEPSLFNKKRAS